MGAAGGLLTIQVLKHGSYTQRTKYALDVNSIEDEMIHFFIPSVLG